MSIPYLTGINSLTQDQCAFSADMSETRRYDQRCRSAPDPLQAQDYHRALPIRSPEEQHGHAVFDTFVRAARASKIKKLTGNYIGPFIIRMLEEKSPVSVKQTAILVSPHLDPRVFTESEYSTRLWKLWVAATSVVPYTDEVGQSVVTTLLRIAPSPSLRPDIPACMWLWLNRRPSLPPGCTGLHQGDVSGVVQTIRALGDIETLTSYLYLAWSECNIIYPETLEEMCTSIREDFGGIWVGYHREDLLRRLSYILEQLNLGLDHLRQHKPSLNGDDIWLMEYGYEQLKEVLLEVDGEAIDKLIRESLSMAIVFGLLTPMWTDSGCHSTFMCAVPLPCL